MKRNFTINFSIIIVANSPAFTHCLRNVFQKNRFMYPYRNTKKDGKTLNLTNVEIQNVALGIKHSYTTSICK